MKNSLPTITQKQRQQHKVVQSLYLPLPTAIAIDEEAKRLGISRSAVINAFISEGLTNNKIKAPQGLQNRGANHDDASQAGRHRSSPTPSSTIISKEVGPT